jgi:RND family efflux transporter MFP subunit
MTSMTLRCFCLATLLLSSPAIVVAQSKGTTPPAPLPPRVFVTTVRKDTVDEPKMFVGTVMPLRKSIVGSAAPGRVEEYLVNEGDFVKKGTPIAHLRRGIIAAEKKAAEAELEVRRAALAEREDAHEDEVLQARAALSSAEANLRFQEAKLERARNLGNAITRESLEETIAAQVQATAAFQNAQAALRLLTGKTWQRRYEQAQARVAAQEAEVERLTEQYERHTMFAPFDGWVTKEYTEVGQWLMQGDSAAEIAELGFVDIEIAVLEDYISKLRQTTDAGPGTRAEVEITALRGQRFSGTVEVINPQADLRSRTFPVKVRVQNIIDERGPLLKGGMFARVTLPVGELKSLPLVPKDALTIGGPRPVVYVVDNSGGKNIVRAVPVTIGAANGQWVSVGENEIRPGDQVVVEGNERLSPGQEIRPEPIEVSYP